MANLIYSGSGINAPEEFLYAVNDGKGQPFVHGVSEKMLFLTIGRDKKNVCGVTVEEKNSHIIKLDLVTKIVEKVTTVENNAIYYPTISPNGDKIAYLETEGKSYPPMRDDSAIIKVLEKKNDKWELSSYRGETLLDPFDWGKDDNTLLFPNEAGDLIEENIVTGEKKTLADNIFYPRLSHSGNILAYYNGEAIVVEKDGKKEVSPIKEDAQYVFFDADDSAVYYIAQSGYWKSAVFKILLSDLSKKSEKVFETSEITFAAFI